MLRTIWSLILILAVAGCGGSNSRAPTETGSPEWHIDPAFAQGLTGGQVATSDPSSLKANVLAEPAYFMMGPVSSWSGGVRTDHHVSCDATSCVDGETGLVDGADLLTSVGGLRALVQKHGVTTVKASGGVIGFLDRTAFGVIRNAHEIRSFVLDPGGAEDLFYILGYPVDYPKDPEGRFTFTGLVVGVRTAPGLYFGNPVQGDARMALLLGAPFATLDLSGIVDLKTGERLDDMSWDRLSKSNMRLSGDHGLTAHIHGKEAQFVAGVFERNSVKGAFGVSRQ